MMPNLEARPVAHRIPNAVRLAGISRSVIYQLIKRGQLPIVKIGRRTLIADDDLRALINRHRVARTAIRPSAFPPTELYRAVVAEQT
jgi:excisionase family DNA binding protein